MNRPSEAASRWHLVVLDGARAGTTWTITGTRTTVGRVAGNDLALDDLTVSREHFVLKLEGETLRLEDTRSTSGTWVNESRVQDELLQPGDVLRAGHIRLRVERDPVR